MRPIAPERENVPNRRFSVSNQNVFDLFFIMTDAGQGLDPALLCVEFARRDSELSLALSRRPHKSR